jgi:hypothetical protein
MGCWTTAVSSHESWSLGGPDPSVSSTLAALGLGWAAEDWRSPILIPLGE